MSELYSNNDWRNYDELRHHGIKGQKWGVKNGPPYPLNSEALASAIYERAKEHVDYISNDVSASAKKAGSDLYGFEHRLKTKESIKRKIEKNSVEDSLTVSKAGSKIKDAVRYTTISDTDDFVQSYRSFKKNMEDLGYTETRCKNYFDMYNRGLVKHKSVQSNFKTPDGYEFEIQFQTPQSQDAKNKKLPLYEERRQVGIDPSRAAYLEKKMEELAEKVPNPVDIDKIKSH